MKIKKLVEEITNFDNIKDPQVVLDPVAGDALEVSKENRKEFDKVTKSFDDPILGKKEDKESPAKDLTEAFESDGWELEDSDLVQVLAKLVDLKYEVDNCVRGSYATGGADTYEELARFVLDLSDELRDCAYELSDIDESLNEKFEWTNGELKDFDPQDLMNKVKDRRTSLFTAREFNNKLYDISIHPHGSIEQPSDIWVDIVVEDEQGNQERIFLKKFFTYDEAVDAMREWKENMIESQVDSVVKEALREDDSDPMDSKLSDEESDIQLIMWYFGVDRQKAENGLNSGFYSTEDIEKARKYHNKKSNPSLEEDGRQSRVNLTPEQKADEKAMAETLFDRVYNELEKDTDGSKNIVNRKASQRYNTEDLSTDINGNIVVYASDKNKLQNAVNVAQAYKLQYKIGPGSIRNAAHALQCVIFIPEDE